jgi:hypothetical protein
LLKKNEFSTIPNAQNENESKGEIENERWDAHFHMWQDIWIYKKSFNWFPFEKKYHPKKNGCVKRQKWKKIQTKAVNILCVRSCTHNRMVENYTILNL